PHNNFQTPHRSPISVPHLSCYHQLTNQNAPPIRLPGSGVRDLFPMLEPGMKRRAGQSARHAHEAIINCPIIIHRVPSYQPPATTRVRRLSVCSATPEKQVN
ncbi:unnamed protein product, partial [Ectocarpus sp. 12 AP-2014]